MSYAKSIFFIPVWFDQLQSFTSALEGTSLWEATDSKKVWAGYLFRYASDINRKKELFASFTLKDPSSLNVYMFQDELCLESTPNIDEVRLSCFSTGVGFMEFWVSYTGLAVDEITNFSYMFKKATSKCKKELPNQQRALYDVANNLLPQEHKAILFFSASARFKYECNCFHFLHLDQEIPDSSTLQATLFRLSRSYRNNMPVTGESAYDMMYEAGNGDYWSGCSEGLSNIVYDSEHARDGKKDYYLHSLKLQRLQTDYYFMYLLLLNQKYSAVEYIKMVAQSLDGSTKYVEMLNRRIVQLKNTFSFNVISDDSIVQNIYSKMFSVLEIHNLLEDVIENEKQMELLQKAKHMKDDRLSNKYLFGISILSLFSALIDSASFFDRMESIRPVSTMLSLGCVLVILILCVVWAVKSVQK
jgi:hypothetical protein